MGISGISTSHPLRLHNYVAVALTAIAHVAALLWLTRDPGEHGQPAASTRENVYTIHLRPVATQTGEIDQAGNASLENQADTAQQSTAEAPNEAHDKPVVPPSPSLPRYYRTSELSSAPIVLQDVLASQPIQISAAKPTAVILTLLINERGEIDQVLVENSELSIDTTKMLAERFARMKFEPGKIDGMPVRSQMKIAIDAAPLQ